MLGTGPESGIQPGVKRISVERSKLVCMCAPGHMRRRIHVCQMRSIHMCTKPYEEEDTRVSYEEEDTRVYQAI
jgi:hypothetical protein